ncbi:MAG: ThiF family adenylyltransferase [Gammaproteobacteria bacterium]|nr:ThiF family adenylyltransferase [Gammaproteobacteria bacterium]
MTREITDLERKRLGSERIAIVGVGGAGSYILDFVAKSAGVSDVHIFDCDTLQEHNVRRTPGPVAHGDLGSRKAAFHGKRYGVAYTTERLTTQNADGLLADCTTVFASLGRDPVKRRIYQICRAKGILLVHVGMGLFSPADSQALDGVVGVTVGYPGHWDHFEKYVGLDAAAADPAVDNNQSAELNAMNAAMAVVKWKKIRRVYRNGNEVVTRYVLRHNAMVNWPPA